MNRIIILDTNFLVSNLGKIKEITEKLKEKNCDIIIPRLVKDEFINIQQRKLLETYSVIEQIEKRNTVLNLKYSDKSKASDRIKEIYDEIFNENFGSNIIEYDNIEKLIDKVLERNKYKLPPFYNESNSSDKGFKDTIILISIKIYIKNYEEDAEFYFITADNGFVKYKVEIEKEVEEELKKKLTIIEGKDKEKIFENFGIEESNNDEEIKTNLFSKNEEIVDIEDVKNRINSLMEEFNNVEMTDYFGDTYIEKRYDLYKYTNEEYVENFLENLKNIILENVFSKEIAIECVFHNNENVLSSYKVDMQIVKDIYETYVKINNTEYKDAFLKFIKIKLNENKTDKTLPWEDNGEELPF